jgi:serine/threonine protein kinase/WD40 repeat protein
MRDQHSPSSSGPSDEPPRSGGTDAHGAKGPEETARDDDNQIEQFAQIDDMLGGLRQADHDGRDGFTDVGASRPASETSAGSANNRPRAVGPLDAMLLLRQVAAMDRGSQGSGTEDDHTETPPPSVDPYEIVGVLGRGGFSVVYEAFDPRISRRLALKVIRPEVMLMPGMRRRFLREAEIAARLRHPNIIVVFDVGSADGRVFLAEEYCEGGSLADWLDAHPGAVPAREAAAFVATLAEAVSAAHANGVLHRDLKPANILLVPAADRTQYERTADTSLAAWQPKVADFGLAALRTDDSGAQLTHLTAEGSRIGTPAWMAPEQIDATFGTVSQTTDIHALGRILERLLTGTPAYRGESDVESFRRILLAPPVPVNQVVPGTSADLAAVCLKCLEKRPANRYSSATSLAADLDRFLAGKPTLARPQSRAEQLARRLASSRWTAVTAALVAVAAIAAGAVGWLQYRTQQDLVRQAAAARRGDASAELLRGFGAWETGNVSMALASLAHARDLEPNITDSLAARWLITRLHNEDEILFRMPGNSPIYASAVSPDGTLVAAGAENGTIACIPLRATSSTNTSQPSPPLMVEAEEEVNTIIFHPNGQTLIAAGQSGGISAWDAKTGEKRFESNWGTPLYGLACSPDGQLLAFGGEDRLLRFANVSVPDALVQSCDLTGIVLGEKTDPEIESIHFIDSQTVAVTLGNQLLKVDTETGEVLRSKSAGHEKTVHEALAWSSAAGLLCVSGGSSGTPLLFHENQFDPVGSLPVHPNWIRSCGFSSDGSQIVTACRDGIIRFFDTQSRRETTRLIGHIGQVWKVAFAGPDTLISTGGDGSVRRWNARANPQRAPAGLAFSNPDALSTDARILTMTLCKLQEGGSRVAAVDVAGMLRLFDPQASRWEELQLPLSVHFPKPFPMTASHSGNRFVATPPEVPSTIVTLDTTGPAQVTPIETLDSMGAKTCWTDDDRLVLAEMRSKRLFILNPMDGQSIPIDESLHQVGYRALAASPVPPTRIFAADHDRLTLFTLDSSGNRLAADQELPVTPDDVVVALWSPDGTQIACGTTSGGVALYDITPDGIAAPRIISSHGREVCGLTFDTSGQTLISVDAASVRIHDAIARVTCDTFTPGFEITGVAISPGDRSIILGTSEGLCTIPLASREQMQADLSQQAGN